MATHMQVHVVPLGLQRRTRAKSMASGNRCCVVVEARERRAFGVARESL